MKKRRFTMVEMLVVIAIMVILAGMTFGVMKMVWRKNADAKTRERIQKLEAFIEEYHKVKGYFPQKSTEGTISSANLNTWSSECGKPKPDSECLQDFYKQGIWYKCPGAMNPKRYDIWSTGADKKHGDGGSAPSDAQTREKNDDLTNWKGK